MGGALCCAPTSKTSPGAGGSVLLFHPALLDHAASPRGRRGHLGVSSSEVTQANSHRSGHPGGFPEAVSGGSSRHTAAFPRVPSQPLSGRLSLSKRRSAARREAPNHRANPGARLYPVSARLLPHVSVVLPSWFCLARGELRVRGSHPASCPPVGIADAWEGTRRQGEGERPGVLPSPFFSPPRGSLHPARPQDTP